MTMSLARARARHSTVASLLAAAAVSGLLGAVACSSSQSPVAPRPDAQAVCPATVGETAGVACASPGLVCAPNYVCGNTNASLYCECTGGTFACHDGLGNAVAAGQSPTCPGQPPATPACPPSLQAANLKACTTPGQICPYPSACASGTYDQCTCFPGETATGGFGTIFTCQQATCPTDAAAPPAPDAGADVTPDAAAEAAPVVDDASPDSTQQD
jgi:hypothetical protein